MSGRSGFSGGGGGFRGGRGGRGGGGGGFRGGRGGRGAGSGGRGGGSGGRGGGSGRFFDQGPPEHVVPLGHFTTVCQDDLVCKVDIADVPYFNAPIYLENKEQIGKIDEIFGTVRDYSVSVKLADNMNAGSFKMNQKLFIDASKLLPIARFLPKAPQPKGSVQKKRSSAGGAGGRGNFGGFNRGTRGGRNGGFNRSRGYGGGGGFNTSGGGREGGSGNSFTRGGRGGSGGRGRW